MENKQSKAQMKVVELLIQCIGDNPKREGLIDTPRRVVKSWQELFYGYNKENEPKVTTFNNGKDGIVYDEAISDVGTFHSFCEHHMLLFKGHYFISYIPHPKGKLLGLSKIARIVNYYGARLQIQERLTHQIAQHLYDKLCEGTKYKPLGVAVCLEAEHSCKSIRGVKNSGIMRTVKLIGCYKDEQDTKSEFLGMVNKNVH
jgi:GTP cyclohydrolase I